MTNKRVSDNFWLSEFGYVYPDPRILSILEAVRHRTGAAIVISDAGRDARTLLNIYLKLEKEHHIKTTGNGLGDKDILDVIPWKSRHLASFGTPYLRAVDFKCTKKTGGYYTGAEIHDIIMWYVGTEAYTTQDDVKTGGCFVGIGIGHNYTHLDIDRKKHTVWRYDY